VPNNIEIASIKSKNSWNKSDLTVILAEEAKIPKVRAAKYIKIMTDTIAEALSQSKKVTISDFGTFQVSRRKSFPGRNPKSGNPLTVPERCIPVFRAGKRLKRQLND
jgi:nucleoid DNA-binding protein